MEEYLNQLLAAPLFEKIRREDLIPMLTCLKCYTRTFRRGEFLFPYGEPLTCLGLVLSGSVHMIEEDVWGNKTILNVIKANGLFGESYVCGSNPAVHALFIAVENSTVLFLPFGRVIHACNMLCGFHHRLIENMVRLIADKNMQMMEKVEVLSQKSLREKILTYLSLQRAHSGTDYFEIPLSRTELAEYLCANRSALTRELAEMKKDGLLDFEKRTFRLPNPMREP